MARKKKITVNLGALSVALGCAARLVQLASAHFGLGLSSNRPLYVAMLCLLCGGFAVMAYEKKGRASLWAALASVCSLMTTVMGNLSNGADALRVISALLLVGMFIFAALIMTASKKGTAKITGIALIAVTLALAACMFFPLPGFLSVILPIAAYVLMGVGVMI